MKRISLPGISIVLSVLLAGVLLAFAPQFALAQDAGDDQASALSLDSTPSVPSVGAAAGAAAGPIAGTGADIVLGVWPTTGGASTNNIYASYNGKNFVRISEIFKTPGDAQDVEYMSGHWPQSNPSIIYHDGYFWSLSGWNKKDGNINLMISYSQDLVHWTHPEGNFAGNGISVNVYPKVDGRDYTNFDIVAPEWTVTSDGDIYIVVSCGRYVGGPGDQMTPYLIKVSHLSGSIGGAAGGNYRWPLGLSMRAGTAQKLNLGSGDFIDGALFADGNTDYLIIKKDGQTNQLYKAQKSATMGDLTLASWRLVNSKVTFGYEGPSIAKLNGTYYLYTDRLKGYEADGVRVTSSSNLVNGGKSWATPKDPRYIKPSGAKINVSSVRHGSVLTLKAGTPGWEAANKLLRGNNNKWNRLWGFSGLDTMDKIVREGWPDNTRGTVVIATADGFKDALSAAGIAGLEGAPVLITSPKALSEETKAQLKRLKPKKVIIAGGEKAIPTSTAREIRSLLNSVVGSSNFTIKRLYGGNARRTAENLNLAYKNKWQDGIGILCTQKSFKDALSVAPISYSKHYPIFLVTDKDTIDDKTISAMKQCGVKEVIVTGGTGVISAKIISKLKSKGITMKVRLGGGNSYGTSKAIAEWGLKNGMVANNIGVATGRNYKDALCGAAFCGLANSVLVLADNNNNTNTAVLKKNKSGIKRAYVFGGESAVGYTTWKKCVDATK
ncbi:MAG: cell wall-binding repeat-containing protein [Eggerthellaceae bacterium]|nr:cell wall-binding repeat-containing protein [Eggerthellaceae bacterium]